MATRKQSAQSVEQAPLEVEKVPLSSLRRTRRSKHHELMQQVLTELVALPKDSALKVPLGKASAKDLRSAVARAASSHSIEIASTSDGGHLYIWKKPERDKKPRIDKRQSR